VIQTYSLFSLSLRNNFVWKTLALTLFNNEGAAQEQRDATCIEKWDSLNDKNTMQDVPHLKMGRQLSHVDVSIPMTQNIPIFIYRIQWNSISQRLQSSIVSPNTVIIANWAIIKVRGDKMLLSFIFQQSVQILTFYATVI